MGFLKTGGGAVQNTAPDYTGLQLQTSVNTLPVPIVYGTVRIAPNIIDSEDFTKKPKAAPGGKFGASNTGTYDYSSTILMALCEGPITGIDQVWIDRDVDSFASTGFTLFTGTTPQSAWGYMTGAHPDKALGYQGTAYIAQANYDLGSGASLPNHNFELQGALRGTGYTAAGVAPNDADPAQCILDFLTNAQYGAGFPAGSIDMTSLMSSSDAAGAGDAALQTYARAVGIAFSVALTSQETATSVLQRWLQLTNCAIFWSGTALKFVPYGDETLVQNGVTFKPDVTPIYDLTDDDFVADGDDGADPVEIQRSDIADAHNVVRIEISDRANQYNALPIEARDESMVNLHGLRVDSTISAHEICDNGAAASVGQLILQRGLYIRNNYTFKLSWEYCLLEPMDLVTLSDPALGLDKEPVRILSIEEDDKGLLTVTAEEFPAGLATATEYPKQGRNPYLINYNVAAESVNPPVIFEPPASLTGGTAQIWIAASGGTDGVADPYWGGAYVWLSSDGTTYAQIGQITRPARQGQLTAALPAPSASPDVTGIIGVSLAQSGGVLLSGTEADAQAWRTLCFVDGELLAYATATLTGSSTYNLSYLVRGLYGTTAAQHLIGSAFVRLDDAIFKYDLPAQDVGSALHVKLQSYNIFGGGVQDLADCFAYGLTPAGTGYYIAPPTGVLITSNARTQSDGSHILTLVISWAPSSGPLLGSYEVQYQTQGSSLWQSVMVGSGVSDYVLIGAQESVTYEARVRAVSTVGNVSAWADADGVDAGALTETVPSTPTGLTASGGTRLIHVTWSANPEPDIQHYLVSSVAATGTFDQAAVIGIVQGTSFDYVNLGYGAAYDFFLQAVNLAGPSAPAGPAYGITDSNIDVNAILDGAITSSKLASDLSTPIALIPTLSLDMSSAQQAISSVQVLLPSIQAGVATAQADVTTETTARQDADTAILSSVTTDLASLGSGPLGAAFAAIGELSDLFVTHQLATARKVTQVVSVIDSNQALVTEQYSTKVDTASSIASAVTAVTSTVNGNIASAVSSLATQSYVDSSIAEAVTGVTATTGTSIANALQDFTTQTYVDSAISTAVTGVIATTGTNTANAISNLTTKTYVDSSIAEAITQVNATTGTSIAAATQDFATQSDVASAIATATEQVTTAVLGSSATVSDAISSHDGLYAQALLQGNINGLVSGIGYFAGPSTSQIVFETDSFLILPPAPAGVNYSNLSATQLQAAATKAFDYDVDTGTLVLNSAIVGTIDFNSAVGGEITTGLLTIRPTAAGQGLAVYDVTGNLILSSAGLAAGSASQIYGTTSTTNEAPPNLTGGAISAAVCSESYTQRGLKAVISGNVMVPAVGDNSGDGNAHGYVQLIIDGTVILSSAQLVTPFVLPILYVNPSTGDHSVQLQLNLFTPQSWPSVTATLVIQDHIA